jgi:hypothetical protein
MLFLILGDFDEIEVLNEAVCQAFAREALGNAPKRRWERWSSSLCNRQRLQDYHRGGIYEEGPKNTWLDLAEETAKGVI